MYENISDEDVRSRRVSLKRWKNMSNKRDYKTDSSHASERKPQKRVENTQPNVQKKPKEKQIKIVRCSPDLGRLQELSKPSKSTLLNTWQTYSEVFDYDRMKRVMNKLHSEFSLTPEEKAKCMEHLRKTATNLTDKLALGSTDVIRKYRLKTEDIQRLSGLTKPHKEIRWSRRTEELACPKPYKVLATWDDYGGFLPTEKRIKFHRKYVESIARITKSQRNQQNRSQTQRKRTVYFDSVKSANSIVEEQDRMLAREAAYKLVEKGVERAILYAEEGRPPPLMTRTLIKLSDNILAVLSDRNLINIPMRDSKKKDAKFLLYVSDWTAKIISDAYLATEKTNNSQNVFTKKYLKGTSDKGIQETILEQDEDGFQESYQEEEEKKRKVLKETKQNCEDSKKENVEEEIVDKNFEDISEIDNSFGNESDWDEETGTLKDEVKHEVKKLSITNSKTEIIHIRKDGKQKEPQKDTETEEEDVSNVTNVEDGKCDVDKNLATNSQSSKIDADKNIQENNDSSNIGTNKNLEENNQSTKIGSDKKIEENDQSTKIDSDKNVEENNSSVKIDVDKSIEKNQSAKIDSDKTLEENNHSCKVDNEMNLGENAQFCKVDGDKNREEITEPFKEDCDQNCEGKSEQIANVGDGKGDIDKSLEENDASCKVEIGKSHQDDSTYKIDGDKIVGDKIDNPEIK